MSRRSRVLVAGCLLLSACGVHELPPTVLPEASTDAVAQYAERNRPDVIGTRGAVVAGHPLAAAAGYHVLRNGGNAVDAAVTMAAVLAVVRPHMNGVGGDAFALFYEAGTREITALNGSGRAGQLATRAFFAAADERSVPMSGARAVTVPGAVSAWAAALERYGTITLDDALSPALRYAEQGFPVSAALSRDLEAALSLNDAGQAIFAPYGVPEPGATLGNPALARTLRQIAAQGPRAIYGGPVGRALAEFVEAEGGHLRLEDFAQHTAEWTDPISAEWDGRQVHAFPPNSQGVVQLLQLGLAERFPLMEYGHNSADYLHALVEIKKLAFADRDRWIADPEFSQAPLDRLLDPEYLDERADLVPERAADHVEPGFGPPITTAAGGSGRDDDGDTVYLMVVDEWGNAVSWIQSLYSSFGSRLVEPTTGVVLHNRGAGFTLQTGHPNVIAPGKRPFHTLTPALVTDAEGRLEMTLGTPGGHGQSQFLLQVLHNVYLFGMSPQEAVEAPRYRSDDGLRLQIENRVPVDAREELSRRGHELRVVDGWTATFGGTQVIYVDPRSRLLRTGADPRREAYAIAY